jgi:DNA (cytosine-5)-methyltransferase 1
MRQRSMQIGNAVPPLMAYHLGQSVEKGTAIDLFAGAGGLGLGLGWAGHDMVLSVDNDSNALKTLAHHASPGHRVEAYDLSNDEQFQKMVNSARAALAGRELGILAGGPPCQGFSTAGPCRVDDPRNKLVLSFLRAVESLRPRDVVFENVPALRWRGKQFLDELLERLGALGYLAELRILHSEAYGVPQLRRRLVVRATRGEQIVWPKPTHSLVTPFFVKDQPGPLIDGGSMPTVHQAIGDLPGDQSNDLDAAVSTGAATSDFARWLRGELQIEELVHGSQARTRILEKAS